MKIARDADFKTLAIRMLTEMVECGHKMDEKVKAMKSEMKDNTQGTNSDKKETGTQITGLDQKEETFNQNRMKKQEFKKMRRSLGTSNTAFKHSNIGIIEGEEEEQEMEKLFEQIMKENFPSLAKEIDMQVQEIQSPKEIGPKEEHTKAHHH